MKEKTRKILKRAGGALLLGLSFLNFGSGWGKQRSRTIIRRTQNIRKLTQEEVDAEIRSVADIAEEEATNVIQKEVQQQQQLQQAQLQQVQTQNSILRYVTIGGWGVVMAVFFTSMIFNQPFGLGKAVLSLLPGEPHVAVLGIKSEKSVWQVNEEAVFNVNLSTNQEAVNYVKLTLEYNPEILEFTKIDINRVMGLEIVNQVDNDIKNGLITFSLYKKKGNIMVNKGVIAKVHFMSTAKTNNGEMKIIKYKSLILKKKEPEEKEKQYNILGRVRNTKFRIIGKIDDYVLCQKLDIVKSRMNRLEWERVINGAPIPAKEEKYWKYLNNNVAMRCAYSDDGGVYVLFYSLRPVKQLRVINNVNKKNIAYSNFDEWLVGGGYLYSLMLDDNDLVKIKPNKFDNLVITLKMDQERFRWPEYGKGEFILETN